MTRVSGLLSSPGGTRHHRTLGRCAVIRVGVVQWELYHIYIARNFHWLEFSWYVFQLSTIAFSQIFVQAHNVRKKAMYVYMIGL